MVEYVSISVPYELMEEVKEFIKNNPRLGYKTPTEFIKEAIRNHLRLSALRPDRDKV